MDLDENILGPCLLTECRDNSFRTHINPREVSDKWMGTWLERDRRTYVGFGGMPELDVATVAMIYFRGKI